MWINSTKYCANLVSHIWITGLSTNGFVGVCARIKMCKHHDMALVVPIQYESYVVLFVWFEGSNSLYSRLYRLSHFRIQFSFSSFFFLLFCSSNWINPDNWWNAQRTYTVRARNIKLFAGCQPNKHWIDTLRTLHSNVTANLCFVSAFDACKTRKPYFYYQILHSEQ